MKIVNSLNKNSDNKNNKKHNLVWIIRISFLAFTISLFLSLFSEIILLKSKLFIALILLIIFTFLNVFSDMVGLAITSCQINNLEKENIEKSLYNKCLSLINNSDKVSSILCDVIGDISGILCGASGTMIAMIISNFLNLKTVNILIISLVSSIIAGITVFFKAIAKKYAIENSVKIVISAGKLLEFNKNFKTVFKKKK